ncbi:MAG: 3-hydroxyacyl-CoA dehydrogenase family protein [Chloroflexi bacterium]|nr:3-hydroxyacyl-CoA dehydrogenase family protein [Chloroflexota bacterium]
MTKVAGIDEVAIVGAGWMGSGISTICALGGYPVNLVDVSQEILDRCVGKIRANLDLLVEADEVTAADADAALGRIQPTTSMADGLGRSQLAIEAVPEKLEIKQEVFVKMEAAARPGTILGTNSSGLPTTDIAALCNRPEQIVGIHVFEPPFVLRAVEVIRGQRTSDDTFEKAVAFVESVGSVPIRVLKDRRSFVINFLQQAMRKAALDLVEAGVTTEEDIIKAARHSFGVKYVAMGPYSARGGVDRANQYEPEALEEMGRRALEMLPVIRAARTLD